MKKRTRYMRTYQKTRRQRGGLASVTVELTKRQRQFIRWCQKNSNHGRQIFLRSSLLVGACMLYNSGGKRGGKKRVKPPRAEIRHHKRN